MNAQANIKIVLDLEMLKKHPKDIEIILENRGELMTLTPRDCLLLLHRLQDCVGTLQKLEIFTNHEINLFLHEE